MDDDLNLSIQLLGGFVIKAGNEDIVSFDRPSLQRLLVYLLLNRGQPVNRMHLAFTFWPDSSEPQALSNLRNLWYRLRQALPDVEKYIVADRNNIMCLNEALFKLDVAEFEGLIDLANRTNYVSVKIEHLQKAIKTYNGELMPGHYDDWLLVERKRLAQAYENALADLVSLHEKGRQYQQAIRFARELIRHDPLHEPAYAQLMRLQAVIDDRAAALHTYHTCATVLEREMGVEPCPLIKDLHQRLLKQELVEQQQITVKMAVPLVGRDASWEILQQAWHRAQRDPQMVLIRGEAGIGKTCLAEAFVDWISRQGIPVLRARCFATEERLAYAPVISWLRGCSIPNLDSPWLAELARLLPEIQTNFPELTSLGPMTEDWQRLRLFEALAKALLTDQKALVLFADDLQWCDRETLDWLAYLLSADHEHSHLPQLLVIAAMRSEECDPDVQMTSWQAELIRSNRLVIQELGPLNDAETFKLANLVYGRPLDPAMRSSLFQATEGHPFIIVELVRSARLLSVDQVAAIVAVSTSLPDRVRQVLEARLAQLSPLAREVIEQASVIGRDFTFPVLVNVTHLSEDGLVQCLDECWQRRIIREHGEEAYDFSHDKLRSVAYNSLSLTRRRWLHKQIAETLEKLHGDEIDRVAAVIAGHYEAAELFEDAIAYCRIAAEAASRVYAYEEELAAVENGLRLLPKLPEGADRQTLAALFQEKKGDLHIVMAANGESRSAYQEALLNTPPVNVLAQARLLCKIGKTMENERMGYDQVYSQYEEAETHLGRPQDDWDPTWWQAWIEIQMNKMDSLYWWLLAEESGDLIEQLRPLIEIHGSPSQQAVFFYKLVNYQFLKNRFTSNDEIIANARAAVNALTESADPDLIALAQFGYGFCLIWSGRLVEADCKLDAAFNMLEKTGNIILQTRCLAYRIVANRLQGDLKQVEEIAKRCLALAKSAGMYDYIGVSYAGLAWLALRQDDPLSPSAGAVAEAARLGHNALDAWEQHGSPYSLQWMALWPLISAALAKDQLVEALGYVRKLFQPDQQVVDPVLEVPMLAALAAWDQGNLVQSQQSLTQALETAQIMNFA